MIRVFHVIGTHVQVAIFITYRSYHLLNLNKMHININNHNISVFIRNDRKTDGSLRLAKAKHLPNDSLCIFFPIIDNILKQAIVLSCHQM